MAVVHTEAAAIFNGQLKNEAEDQIQYIKYRPSQPFNSNTPINFTIPGNSSQYISLHDSYMFVQCHVEETDQFGNPITTSTPAYSNSNVVVEVNNEEDEGYEMGEDEEGEEEDMEQEEEDEDKSKVTRAVPSNILSCPFLASAKDVQEYLEEAEHKYIKWQGVSTSFKSETTIGEKVKHIRRKERLYQNALVPIDNVLRSLWSGCNITMNGELVSTTNQKYMYK